jgi:hypothetical protein
LPCRFSETENLILGEATSTEEGAGGIVVSGMFDQRPIGLPAPHRPTSILLSGSMKETKQNDPSAPLPAAA